VNNKNKTKNRAYAAAALLLSALVLVGLFVMMNAQRAEAGAVTNYYTQTVLAGSTTYTTTGGQTGGLDVSGYGEAIVHIEVDASNTTSTLTVYPQYSNQTVACSLATDWFTGTDYYHFLTQPEVSYTVASTDSLSWTSTGSTTITGSAPYVITTTYAYGSASANAYSFQQSMSTTGDDDGTGEAFTIYGRCMRLNLAVSYGTVTPTVYMMTRDYQE